MDEMRFDLSDTPFRDIHTYSSAELLDYLDYPLKELVVSYRTVHKTALPPCAFVFSATKVSYLFGYSCGTPEEFIEKVKSEVLEFESSLVLLLTTVGSITVLGKAAFLVLEVQVQGQETIRCAYDMLGSGHLPVDDDWTFQPGEDVNQAALRNMDSVSRMVEESSTVSHLLGLSSFFRPVL